MWTAGRPWVRGKESLTCCKFGARPSLLLSVLYNISQVLASSLPVKELWSDRWGVLGRKGWYRIFLSWDVLYVLVFFSFISHSTVWGGVLININQRLSKNLLFQAQMCPSLDASFQWFTSNKPQVFKCSHLGAHQTMAWTTGRSSVQWDFMECSCVELQLYRAEWTGWADIAVGGQEESAVCCCGVFKSDSKVCVLLIAQHLQLQLVSEQHSQSCTLSTCPSPHLLVCWEVALPNQILGSESATLPCEYCMQSGEGLCALWWAKKSAVKCSTSVTT